MAKQIKKITEQVQLDDSSEFTRILNSLPEQERQVILASMTNVTSFSGPLPHPQIMEGYEQIQKGFAERILLMTERQTNHRIKQEDIIVRRSLNQKLFGMILGGIFTLTTLGMIFYLALQGHDWLAGVLGTTTLIGIASIFVLGYSPKEKERDNTK